MVCFYNKHCSDYKAEVKNALLGLHAEAVDTVRGLMLNGSEATRLKTAIWLLEKVEAVEVGATDVRAALKAEHSTPIFDIPTPTLNDRAYRQALKDWGLSE